MTRKFRYYPSAPQLVFLDIDEEKKFLWLIPYWKRICHKMFNNDEEVINWINDYVKSGDPDIKYVTVENKAE